MFTPVPFIIATCWKQPTCPSVNEWIKKLQYKGLEIETNTKEKNPKTFKIMQIEYYAAERK